MCADRWVLRFQSYKQFAARPVPQDDDEIRLCRAVEDCSGLPDILKNSYNSNGNSTRTSLVLVSTTISITITIVVVISSSSSSSSGSSSSSSSSSSSNINNNSQQQSNHTSNNDNNLKVIVIVLVTTSTNKHNHNNTDNISAATNYIIEILITLMIVMLTSGHAGTRRSGTTPVRKRQEFFGSATYLGCRAVAVSM